MECRNSEPDDSVQAWLMRMFHRYSAVNYWRIFRQLSGTEIHPGQLLFLKAISEQEGIRQGELVQILHVKPSTVAVTMKRMERSEIICRKQDSSDMRVSRIFLTEKGRQLADRIQGILKENEEVLTEGFTEEELQLMKACFARMMQNMEQFLEES